MRMIQVHFQNAFHIAAYVRWADVWLDFLAVRRGECDFLNTSVVR